MEHLNFLGVAVRPCHQYQYEEEGRREGEDGGKGKRRRKKTHSINIIHINRELLPRNRVDSLLEVERPHHVHR